MTFADSNKPTAVKLISVDEAQLESDPVYRFRYIANLIGFDQQDINAIHQSVDLLEEQVPKIVDTLYEKLFRYDATKRHFLPRQTGFQGAVPKSLTHLTLDHEQIRYRKGRLRQYFMKLGTAEYDETFVAFLDLVGHIHTSSAGSAILDVPLVQVLATLGLIADLFSEAIARSNISPSRKPQTDRAFSKLFWIQCSLIVRHHVPSPPST